MPKLAVAAFNVPMISNLDEFNRPHDPRRLFLERGGPAVDRPSTDYSSCFLNTCR